MSQASNGLRNDLDNGSRVVPATRSDGASSSVLRTFSHASQALAYGATLWSDGFEAGDTSKHLGLTRHAMGYTDSAPITPDLMTVSQKASHVAGPYI